VAAGLLLVGPAPPASAAILYGVNGTPRGGIGAPNLLILDPATGMTVQTVGPIGFPTIAGLAVNPLDGAIYATTGGRGTSNDSLIRIDPTTGRGTLIGNLNIGGTLSDITFDPTGR
jgi:hypothetical protein